MKGIPPQLIALFCIMFIALGIYNILIARRRQQRESLQGIHVPWYKQIAILTGIEFILLAFIFLLNIGISYKVLPASLDGIIFPFSVLLILASGLVAGFVIYRGLMNTQRQRTLAPRGAQVSITDNRHIGNNSSTQALSVDDMTPEERAAYAQKRRDRRQKAASARRRKAGKA